MAVRAKMRVTGRREWSDMGDKPKVEGVEVTLQAVYAGKDEKANADWSKWTPSGELKLCITNPDAFNQLHTGKSFYVDLTPAED